MKKFLNFLAELFGFKKREENPLITEPRENKKGEAVTTIPAPPVLDEKGKDVNAITLPDFKNKDKWMYPLASKYLPDPDFGSEFKPSIAVFHHTCSYNLNSTVDYFKKEPDTKDDKLDLDQDTQPEPDSSINFSTSCPAKIPLTFNF